MSKDQKQEATNGGVAIQAGRDLVVTQVGLSYAEVRDVALDVFRQNFHQLAGAAAATATARAQEITEAFLAKLQEENPAGLNEANDPDFQYALFSVQKEYARNGDKNLGDLLVDLLVDRSKQPTRHVLQIVLNESLTTAPKLTRSQLATLSVVFFLRYTKDDGLRDHAAFGRYMEKYLSPFAADLVKNDTCFQHLEFCGCGAVALGERSLELIIRDAYQGLFVAGFEADEISRRSVSIGADSRFFIQCHNDKAMMQVNAVNQQELAQKLKAAEDVPILDKDRIVNLFNTRVMSPGPIGAKCAELSPSLSTVLDVWSKSLMKNFTLTSVGIAIGHANMKRLLGEFADLSVWIN